MRRWAAAAESKPALTVAFAGYDELIDSLKALDQLSGHTKLAAMTEANIKSQTHGKGVTGLDKSRPGACWSLWMTTVSPSCRAFFPSPT